MFGWRLRHDPSAQLPIPRVSRQNRRSIVAENQLNSQIRKSSHSSESSNAWYDERRRLLPERRKTLATSTIPKDLFLIASTTAVSSSNSSLIEETIPKHVHLVPVRGGGDCIGPRSVALVRRQHSISLAGVSTTSATGIQSTVIIEEDASGNSAGDHCRTRPFDFTYADQCELEDLLDRAGGTGVKPLTLGDANFPLTDAKYVTQASIGGKNDDTLQDISESRADEESSVCDESKKEWKNEARKFLLHVGLVMITCAYTLIGASIFYVIEQPYERDVKQRSIQQIYRAEEEMLGELFRLARHEPSVTEEAWHSLSRQRMLNLTDLLYKSFAECFLTSKEIRDNDTTEIWSFSTSVFFAATVVTTIGYGSPVPVTFPGRLVCVFFALFGIPLTLLTIANLGKFLSERLLSLYGLYLTLMQKVESFRARFQKRPNPANNGEKHEKPPADGHPMVCEKCRRPSGCGGRLKDPLHELDLQGVEPLTVPASVVLSILIGYTALGGLVFCHVENWDFFESFYFSLITMTTIGFGDLVPKNSLIILILLYIVLGLAITTMCIDLVGAHYVRKIHYFGRKIQDARSALAIVGGKVVYVGELYAQLMSKRYGLTRDQLELIPDAFIIENLYLTKHLIPFIPRDIKRIRYIDEDSDSFCSSTSTMDDTHSCRFCHGRLSNVSTTHTTLLKPPTSSVGRSPRYNRV